MRHILSSTPGITFEANSFLIERVDETSSGFTSPIVDAHVLKKPVISLTVRDNDWGIPTALKNESCLITDIDGLEDTLNSVLNNEHIKNELIQNGIKSSNEYLSHQSNGSAKLIGFLEELVK